ncbi:protein cup-like [Anopheles cruzii]|uniref:protein cup-like n=1 Tax=Anopheles cruzii TaxID=68878 RepID=UPI0022EC8040|nr:protein cup-like [Anopheles cruzii]
MMKFVTSDNSSMASSSLRHAEQYDNCSELLIESDATPLKELDPAILSCGLPAIVFGGGAGGLDRTSAAAPTILRYTFAQLLAFRKIPLSHRRPVAIDDPRTGQYPIWQRNGFRPRASGSDEELYHAGGSGAGRKPNDRHRDNGFNPPRFRRNHEFSNRNHHVIVKSYSAGDSHQVRLQDTVIEEEPEWVVAGPTSRLDTIELRGFDDDMTRTVTDTIKASPTVAAAAAAGPSRAQSFYDALMHYEHVHPKHGAKHDTSGSADGESVSNPSSSSPPARSTPTKHVTDLNNNSHAGPRKGGKGGTAGSSGPSGSSSSSAAGVNVSNFEEFMKFDSILGDSGDGDSSRFSKYFRRGGAPGAGDSGQYHHRQHHPVHGQHSGSAPHVRFALDRNTQHHYQRQPGSGRLSMAALQNLPGGMERSSLPYDAPAPGGHTTDTEDGGSKSFQHLVDMIAAQNQRMQQQQQQQYLLQLLQNSQQSESLRQMLMKNSRDAGVPAPPKGRPQSGGGAQQQGPGRVPTQRELQLHTQSIMKNALLRKKIVEQSRLILEQQEPIPAVQQLIRSICPNVQRSLAVLAAGANSSSQQQQQQHNNLSGDAGYGAPFGSGKRGQARAAGSSRRY